MTASCIKVSLDEITTFRKRDYTNPILRILSFDNSNKKLYAAAEQLADAGFYFSASHKVACHQCELKLSNTSIVNKPLIQHRLLSPNCKFIAALNKTIRPARTLQTTLAKRHPLTPLDLFQAVHRLKHYITFPFMNIEDKVIDSDAVHYWNTRMHLILKNAYRFVRQQQTMMQHITSPRYTYRSIPKTT